MIEWKNYTKCELCIHRNVCSYKENQQEILSQIIAYSGNFAFSFECKDYIPKDNSELFKKGQK